MVKKFLFIMLPLVMSVVFWGCAKVPQVEIDAAQAAIEAAKSGEVNRYFASEFNALQDSLNVALANVEAQKSKFALTRNYGSATEKLVQIAQNADSLKGLVAEKKLQLRTEVDQKVVEYTNKLKETKALVARAPRGKETRAVIESMNNDIKAIETSYAEVQTFLAKDDVLSAKERVDSVIAKLQAIQDELKAAIAKKG